MNETIYGYTVKRGEDGKPVDVLYPHETVWVSTVVASPGDAEGHHRAALRERYGITEDMISDATEAVYENTEVVGERLQITNCDALVEAVYIAMERARLGESDTQESQ